MASCLSISEDILWVVSKTAVKVHKPVQTSLFPMARGPQNSEQERYILRRGCRECGLERLFLVFWQLAITVLSHILFLLFALLFNCVLLHAKCWALKKNKKNSICKVHRNLPVLIWYLIIPYLTSISSVTIFAGIGPLSQPPFYCTC